MLRNGMVLFGGSHAKMKALRSSLGYICERDCCSSCVVRMSVGCSTIYTQGIYSSEPDTSLGMTRSRLSDPGSMFDKSRERKGC